MQNFMINNFDFSYPNNLFLLTGLIINIFIIFNSWKKIKGKKGLYFFIIFIYFFSSILVVSSNNWLIFITGWELVTLTTSLLLLWDSKSTAWEYFLIQFLGGSFLILTVLIAYTNGYQSLSPISEFWLQLMFIISVGIKSALIFFHIWLPYIYKKASSTFCALSSAWVAKLGYITLLKVISQGNRILLYIGMIMIFYGGIKALEEKNYKLILAYSSISQFGFITTAIGSGNIYGYAGAVLHIIAHAFAKTILFNGASNWIKEFNSNSIFDFKNCLNRQKINAISTTLAFLSLMAFPLFIGYNSKYLIKNSLNSIPIFVLLLHLGSILTVGYSVKILWVIIFKDIEKSNLKLKKNTKINYKLNIYENLSLIIPAVSLIFLALSVNIYLKEYFDFQYISGLFTTLIYLVVAYLIRFPVISRIKDK